MTYIAVILCFTIPPKDSARTQNRLPKGLIKGITERIIEDKSIENTMATYLQTLLEQESEDHNMIVTHFNGISDLDIEPKSLDAVLIDESQDIKEDDFRKIVPLLASLESPLTIFHDPRQSIYSSKNTLFEADFNKNRTIAALGYVALSRAKEKCFIYYREKNEAVEILEKLLERFK